MRGWILFFAVAGALAWIAFQFAARAAPPRIGGAWSHIAPAWKRAANRRVDFVRSAATGWTQKINFVRDADRRAGAK